MSKKDDLLTLAPMEEYTEPELPTYTDDMPDLEKKVPSRWKNKAMIVAATGLLSVSPLIGYPANDFTRHDCGEGVLLSNFAYDLCIRVHHGGFSGAPIYVAHLTAKLDPQV